MRDTASITRLADRIRALIASTPQHATSPGADKASQAFNQLALELFEHQKYYNPVYEQFCAHRGVQEAGHWTEIPAIPTAAFKEDDLSCISPTRRKWVFHSSGTTTEKVSQQFHHKESLSLYEASLWTWFRNRCGSGIPDHRFIFLTPHPTEGLSSSLLHMFKVLVLESGNKATWCGANQPSGNQRHWIVKPKVAIDELTASQSSGKPIALFGTAFNMVDLLEELERANLTFALPAGSWILETGGYKGRSRTFTCQQLHDALTGRLGIPANRIVREYGMCELSSQAYDRVLSMESPPQAQPQSSFALPPWCRVRIVSPETGQEVEEGQTGLITLYDLANAWSVLAIQTEDLGERTATGFQLVGRAPKSEPRGCSLHSP